MDDRIIFGAPFASVEVLDTVVLLESVVLPGLVELRATGWLDKLHFAAELADENVSEPVRELRVELLGELLIDVLKPASFVGLLREATDVLPEIEAEIRALNGELLKVAKFSCWSTW